MFLHCFNPGNEEAICSGLVNYTPSANVQRMSEDLACLPLWYANTDDYVWAEGENNMGYAMKMRDIFPDLARLYPEYAEGDLKAEPWGMAPNILAAFKRLKEKYKLPMQIPAWHDVYKVLAGRQTACEVLLRVRNLLPDEPFPESPQFYYSSEDLRRALAMSEPPFVLKMPLSSSGRGLLWVYSIPLDNKELQWIAGAFRKQGAISMERALDKVQDFAMEFSSDGQGRVEYKGLSIFGTHERGTYTGNVLGSERYRESFLLKYVPKERLECVKQALIKALGEIYASVYAGCIGVDMLLYRSGDAIRIHPCVEVNMRHTMGMLAIRLSKRLAPDASGSFWVKFEKNAGEAYQKHLLMQKKYPLVMENGLIRQGYLNLNTVVFQTKYSAYLLVL